MENFTQVIEIIDCEKKVEANIMIVTSREVEVEKSNAEILSQLSNMPLELCIDALERYDNDMNRALNMMFESSMELEVKTTSSSNKPIFDLVESEPINLNRPTSSIKKRLHSVTDLSETIIEDIYLENTNGIKSCVYSIPKNRLEDMKYRLTTMGMTSVEIVELDQINKGIIPNGIMLCHVTGNDDIFQIFNDELESIILRYKMNIVIEVAMQNIVKRKKLYSRLCEFRIQLLGLSNDHEERFHKVWLFNVIYSYIFYFSLRIWFVYQLKTKITIMKNVMQQ